MAESGLLRIPAKDVYRKVPMGSNPSLSAMKVPDDWPRPAAGKWMAVCKNGYSRGQWFIIDHTGKVITERDAFGAARLVNQHNNPP